MGLPAAFLVRPALMAIIRFFLHQNYLHAWTQVWTWHPQD